MGEVAIRLLAAGDAAVLDRVADDVFDGAVVPELAREFVDDPRHHIVVALEDEIVVGFVSAVHYLHPDKRAEMFINEVGVAPSHQRRDIGKRLLAAMIEHAHELGCRGAWVLTEEGNAAARGLYAAAGAREDEEPPVLYSFDLKQR